MPSTHFSARRREALASSLIESSRFRAISGTKTLSSKWPCMPPTVIAASLPITCAATCVTTSGMTGFTLPGMIELPFCSSGQEDLGEAGARAGAQEAQVVRDLRQRDGDGLQRARRLDEGVARRLRLEGIGGRVDREPGVGGEPLAHARGELGMRVEAGADGGAAERDLPEARQRVAHARASLPDLRGVAARTPGRA